MANYTEYYVDSTSGNNGNAGTSAGAAWLTLAHAFSNITLGAAVGTRLNVKGSFTENISTCAITPTTTQCLAVQGYTTTAGDGGKFTINGGGASIFTFSKSNINYIDGVLTNAGATAFVTNANTYISFVRMKFEAANTTANILTGATGFTSFYDCWIDQLVGPNMYGGYGLQYVVGCYIKFGTSSTGNGTRVAGEVAVGNIVVLTSTTSSIYINAISTPICLRNIVIHGSGANQTGIAAPSSTSHCLIEGNYVEGFTGATGRAIWASTSPRLATIRGNGYYNCTNGLFDDSGHNGKVTANAMTLLSTSGLLNYGTGDYRPTDEMRQLGHALQFNNAITPLGDNSPIGPIEIEPSGGGGFSGSPFRNRVFA